MLILLACAQGCDEGKKTQAGTVTVVGRVFSADEGKPLAGVEVSAPDGTVVKSKDDGSFTLTQRSNKQGPIEAKQQDFAPASKQAPKGDGYVELFVKRVDGKQQVALEKGGKVEAKAGASVTVAMGSLTQKNGGAAEKATVALASPDPHKPTELSSLPGNFDAKNGTKRGKISAQSTVHVTAADGDKDLVVASGKHVDAEIPARRADMPSEAALFRFDISEQSWVFVSDVPLVGGNTKPLLNAQVDPNPVYRAQLDQLGWWAVGEFFDELTCLRACVVDRAGKAVPFARAIATGVDHLTQLTSYADEKGCFAVDVRAKAQISLSVQASGGLVAPRLITTPEQQMTVDQDPSACMDLGELVLESTDAGTCPLGLRECGDVCVDVLADPSHCGSCDNACADSAGGELSCVAGQCSCLPGQLTCMGDMGDMDAGVPDSGTDSATNDAGPALEADAGGADAGVPAMPDGGATMSASPKVSLSPSTQAFGPTLTNQTSPVFQFTIINQGNGAATGCSAPMLTGAQASDFSIVADKCGTSDLAPGASCTVDVSVTPAATGERTATLSRSCDQGGSVATNPNGLSVNRPHFLFVTSVEHDGNLGGLSGADAFCNTRAAAGSLSSPLNLTWRALLSVAGTVDARDRVKWTGPVYDIRNLLATYDPEIWPWVVDGTNPTGPNLLAASENGESVGSYVWTGSDSSGQNVGADCNGWTSNDYASSGRAGENGGFVGGGGTWLDSFTNNCSDTFFALLCVSDGPMP